MNLWPTLNRMVLADVFAHQNFRKQTPDMPDSPPSVPEPDSPSSAYHDVSRGPSPESRSGR